MAKRMSVRVRFTERETQYADRTYPEEWLERGYVPRKLVLDDGAYRPEPDESSVQLARAVVNGTGCRYCGRYEGQPCLVWNHDKNKNRAFPHAIRYSDYNRRKRERLPEGWALEPWSQERIDIATIKSGAGNDDRIMEDALDRLEGHSSTNNPCTSRDCPSGLDCTDSCMERARKESKVVSRRVLLEKQAERVMEELERLEIFGDDVYENETVLMINFRHGPSSDITYSYVAAKLDGRWYVTGYQNEGPRSWDKLVELFLSHGEVVEVWMISGWEQIL